MSGSGGDGEGSGNAAGLKETPIDDPFMVYRGIPEHTHVSLPHYYDILTDSSTEEFFAHDQYFRMTSPYDCVRSRITVDSNAGAGTMNVSNQGTDGASVQNARWYQFYAGMYKYYTVLACRWSVMVENLSNEPLHVYSMYYNQDLPPTGATNIDMQAWSGVKHERLAPVSYAIDTRGFVDTNYQPNTANTSDQNFETGAVTGDTYNYRSGNHVSHPGTKMCIMSDVYRPGDFRREIRLDSDVENWTAVTTNPILPEMMLIRIKPDNDAVRLNSAENAGDNFKYRTQVKLEYLVEFKELDVSLRYPVQAQPITVTLAANAGVQD